MNGWRCLATLSIAAALMPSTALTQQAPPLSRVHDGYPAPLVPFDEEIDQGPYDDTLGAAIAEAYAGNPELASRRYDLRAIDDDIGIALSLARPTAQVQVAGGYELLLPGDITDAARPISDRLNDPNIERNDISTQLVIDQPLWSGGRISSAVNAATAASLAGREVLRASEGDLLLDLMVAYTDARRDAAILLIRRRNVEALAATLDEINARREAGELTRTDIAQGEVQYQSALVQFQAAEADHQASRAAFATIVGRAPGRLAPEPDLPGLPASLDEAFAIAEAASPELAAAIATERQSSFEIAQAEAEGRPQLSLQGSAGTSGPVSPFDRRDQDVTFAGRGTLSFPLSAGGRVRSQIAQARNRNIADELRIEASRRELVQGIVVAWNQWASTERNAAAQEAQLRSARVFFEGTNAEYREGLRSTFDVLFAQNSLREAQISLISSRHDSFVARAILLRRMGQLEARALLEAPELYNPEEYAQRARNRSAVPWGPIVRALDGIGAPGGESGVIDTLSNSEDGLRVTPPVVPPGQITDQVLPPSGEAYP